jgi:hypothetical protein
MLYTSFDIFDKEMHYGQLVHKLCFSLYVNEFKNGIIQLAKERKGYLFAGSHSIFSSWRTDFFQLVNVYRGGMVFSQLKCIWLSHWCLVKKKNSKV